MALPGELGLGLAFEASVDALFALDEHAFVLRVNPAAERLLGRPATTIVGERVASFLRSPVFRARAELLAPVADFESAELAPGFIDRAELLRSDGRILLVGGSLSILPEGRVASHILSLRERSPLGRRRSVPPAESNRLLASAIEVAGISGFELAIDSSAIRWFGAMHQLLELDEAYEPTAHSTLAFLSPESLSVVPMAIERTASEGIPFDLDIQVITARGRRRAMRMRGRRMDSPDVGATVLGILEDVTEGSLELLSLKRNEARHRDLLDRAPLGVFEVTPDGRLIRANRALAEMLGCAEHELVGLDLGADVYVDPQERERLRAKIEAKGSAIGEELKWRRKDGTTIDVSVSGRSVTNRHGVVTAYEGYAFDVTESRREERARKESERRFRALLDHVGSTVLEVDRDGRILFANGVAASWAGRDAAELVGRTLEEWFPGPEIEAFRRRIAEVLATATPSQVEYAIERPQGVRHVLTLVYPVPSERGEGASTAVLVAHDVTRRREVESQWVVKERMLRMGTLAAGIAHEINNPLAYVLANLGFAEDALHDLAAESRDELRGLRQAIAEARTGAERVRAISRDLALLGRPDETRPVPVDVAGVVESVLRMVRNELRHRATIVVDVPPSTRVSATEPRLAQVLTNLVVNALRAMPERAPGENRIEIRVEDAGPDRVAIVVRDNGSGIPPEIRERIFEPLFTTRRGGLGSGLGLAISSAIVRGFDGELSVESTVGVGSTFTVTLPRAASVEERAERTSVVPVPIRDRRPHILVVDDDDGIRRVVRRMLKRTHDVDDVPTAKEALDRIESGLVYDAVLCDLMMPEMGGQELYERLAAHPSGIADRFVFLSGGAFTDSARDFVDRVGRARLVDKPFERAELERALARRGA